jgi:acetylglutamate kinase
MLAPTVFKFGGELLETPERARAIARAVAPLVAGTPTVIVHGGGREIDAECARRGIAKVAVDGLRVTDAATLDAVVAVLAGTINTRLVGSLVDAGLRAVGLTGADAGCVRVGKSPPHRSVDGRLVDLGLVGLPITPQPATLVGDLLAAGYVPVLACLGADAAGQIYNVNADTLAAHVAASCHARSLVIAGGTAGVLDAGGGTIAELDLDGLEGLIADGTATAGMVAKLSACRDAVRAGVADVRIVDGRSAASLVAPAGTRLVADLLRSTP